MKSFKMNRHSDHHSGLNRMMTGHNRNTRLFFWHDICKSFKGDRDFWIGENRVRTRERCVWRHLAFSSMNVYLKPFCKRLSSAIQNKRSYIEGDSVRTFHLAKVQSYVEIGKHEGARCPSDHCLAVSTRRRGHRALANGTKTGWLPAYSPMIPNGPSEWFPK